MGAAVIQPYVDGDALKLANYALTTMALALHAFAIYIAPVNPEKADD